MHANAEIEFAKQGDKAREERERREVMKWCNMAFQRLRGEEKELKEELEEIKSEEFFIKKMEELSTKL